MGRRKKKENRHIAPDSKYNDMTVARFINYIMERGKKTVATKVVYDSFEVIKEKTKKDPLDVFNDALNKISPLLEVKSKRVGGATYQVPMEVRGDRRQALAFRWLISAAKSRKGMPMHKKLATELMDAANETGNAIKRKEDVHRMAESNRAFAHFAR